MSELRTLDLRKGAGDFGAFIVDLFSWRSFCGYRQRPEALVVASVSIGLGWVRAKIKGSSTPRDGWFCWLFLFLLLPLPVTFAWSGTGRLGDGRTFAVTALVWAFALAIEDLAERKEWRTAAQVLVFAIFTMAEISAVVCLGHVSVRAHPHLSGFLWGVVAVGAVDISASLVTLIVRLRNGAPFGEMLEDDWSRVRARGFEAPA